MANNTPGTYVPLEPSFVQSLGLTAPTFGSGGTASLLSSTTFLWGIGLMLCFAAAGVMFIVGSGYLVVASEPAQRKGKEILARAAKGLFMVACLFVFIYTFNSDLLKGDVGLSNLKASPVAGTTVGTGGGGAGNGGGGSGGSSSSCADTSAVIASLSSQNGVCGNTQCTALTGCKYDQYMTLIQSKAQAAGVSPSIVIAIMCKESKGDPNAQHPNADGTFDCGLMQVNQRTPCAQASLDPGDNISAGIQKIKSALGAAGQLYKNIPPTLGAFANYNCCSNGTKPNDPSADCTQAAGFPYSIPKWACPINPGTSASNMCTVKNYACDVQACINQLDSM
jgi:hypothetical protein